MTLTPEIPSCKLASTFPIHSRTFQYASSACFLNIFVATANKGRAIKAMRDRLTSTKKTAIVAPIILSRAVSMLPAHSLAKACKLSISEVMRATNTPVLFFSK